MNPETANPNPLPTSGSMGKKLLFIGLAAVVLLAVIVAVFVMMKGDRKPQKQTPQQTPKAIQTTVSETPFRYAGNPLYDACTLLTLDTVQAQVKDYKTILAHLGESKIESSPLTLEHTYLDRDIAQPLGNDGQARATGNTAGPNAFGSLFDSNCVYGQGGDVGKKIEFARLYITQKPTPLSPDLLAYLARIPNKQTVGSLDVYQIAPGGGDTFYSVILIRHDKSLAVLLRSATKELALAGANEIAKKLESSPKGPLNVTYPTPYAKLIDTCKLLSASDFQQFTGKPASALAQETLYLNDLNALTIAEELHPLVSAVRQCRRLETDRSVTDNIAQTTVALRQFRNEASAEKYVTDLKNDDIDGLTIQPSKNPVKGADEAYVKVDDDPNPALPAHTFEMRLGAAIITLNVERDLLRADKTAEAYDVRILPAAQLVADNYLKQIK